MVFHLYFHEKTKNKKPAEVTTCLDLLAAVPQLTDNCFRRPKLEDENYFDGEVKAGCPCGALLTSLEQALLLPCVVHTTATLLFGIIAKREYSFKDISLLAFAYFDKHAVFEGK